MIDIKELRVGNYVLAHNSNYDSLEVKSVFDIQHESASLEAKGICFMNGKLTKVNLDKSKAYIFVTNPFVYQLINPIPLTEELLSKCGFEKKQWGNSTLYYHPLIELDANFCLKCVDYNIQVKSLHQLQNIYFDLIGKELEVNL